MYYSSHNDAIRRARIHLLPPRCRDHRASPRVVGKRERESAPMRHSLRPLRHTNFPESVPTGLHLPVIFTLTPNWSGVKCTKTEKEPKQRSGSPGGCRGKARTLYPHDKQPYTHTSKRRIFRRRGTRHRRRQRKVYLGPPHAARLSGEQGGVGGQDTPRQHNRRRHKKNK